MKCTLLYRNRTEEKYFDTTDVQDPCFLCLDNEQKPRKKNILTGNRQKYINREPIPFFASGFFLLTGPLRNFSIELSIDFRL